MMELGQINEKREREEDFQTFYVAVKAFYYFDRKDEDE